jgi:hypothetical protein
VIVPELTSGSGSPETSSLRTTCQRRSRVRFLYQISENSLIPIFLWGGHEYLKWLSIRLNCVSSWAKKIGIESRTHYFLIQDLASHINFCCLLLSASGISERTYFALGRSLTVISVRRRSRDVSPSESPIVMNFKAQVITSIRTHRQFEIVFETRDAIILFKFQTITFAFNFECASQKLWNQSMNNLFFFEYISRIFIIEFDLITLRSGTMIQMESVRDT